MLHDLIDKLPSSRQQHPIVELEHDRGIVLVAVPEWEVLAGVIFRGDRAQAQRAHAAAARKPPSRF